ncbi:uncharacterized protein LOC142177993 [Nicotiana tabacum]|uniref:Uncharacterized protein LOC142177993 n=1 Tax=Nicotiana tabacum TaxID=4097 RepID=A0AC58U1S4_TOBAC
MGNVFDIIGELEVVDPPLTGGMYTWSKGENHDCSSIIDRFLFYVEWDEEFSNIKQSLLPRINSDHCPILLIYRDWEFSKSYFKFENWWMEIDGFKERVEGWWNSFQIHGRPDYVLACKLKYLKTKLKQWYANNYGSLKIKKIGILDQIQQ